MADQEIFHKIEYIERERIEKFFDGIYDCADLVFEPNDHCCAADDCAHCKWRETMNAIKKRILSIPTADVRPVVMCRDCKCYQQSHYIDNHMECARSGFAVHSVDFCSFGEKREES